MRGKQGKDNVVTESEQVLEHTGKNVVAATTTTTNVSINQRLCDEKGIGFLKMLFDVFWPSQCLAITEVTSIKANHVGEMAPERLHVHHKAARIRKNFRNKIEVAAS